MSGNIKVVVRCRPLNAREKARGATSIIRMEGNQTIITKKASSGNHLSNKRTSLEDENAKAFTFDRSYWSADKADDHYADQELVYNDLGRELLDHAFDGYNCCIFAYGQTGSGKSYSMMGYGEDKGIIPRTCSELFERISYLTSDVLKFQVEVSYIEIYNEKVRDLLNPGNKGNLKVREHPTIGPYVEDLSRLVVNSFEDIDHLMNEGNKARTVAATNMNETSSRSHAVFTLFLTSNRFDQTANLNTEKASRISLVDLAGSERANSTGATGVRLKEGANINKSLTTLGKVIAALAEASSHHSTKRSSSSTLNPNFVPYRDSVLTWLLKDSLGGNSKTAMIAAISPADYDETMSTLRYADQAKRIKNKAVVNEDPNARLIRELKEELQALRDTLMIYAPEEVEKIIQQKKSKMTGSRTSSRASAMSLRATSTSPMLLISPESPIATQRGNSLLTKEQVIDQLQSSEKLLSQVNQTWEEKMNKTEEIHRQREKALAELGVIVEKDSYMVGVYAPKTIHLINLNEDPLMTECLMYQIKSGITSVGKLGSQVPADIRLSGNEIMDEHCYFENNLVIKEASTTAKTTSEKEAAVEAENRVVTIYPGKDSVTLVNGMRILEPKVLHSGYRIIFGSGLHHLFRFNNPDEVRREREQQQQQGQRQPSSPIDDNVPTSPTSPTAATVDWKFAHSEAVQKYGVTNNTTDLAVMTDEDLKHLSDGITKVREFRNRTRISSDSHQQLFSNYGGDFFEDVSPRTSVSSSSNKRFSAISSAPTLMTEEEEEEEEEEEDLVQQAPSKKEENERLIRLATEEMERKLQLQKQEYEAKLKMMESSNMKADELNKERDELAAKYTQIKQKMERTLEEQKMAYESKIKRISRHLPPGTTLSSDNLSVGYTAKNAAQHLVRKAVTKWRELKYVKMAEDCLVNAVVLKEANIMAKELGKNVVYQFTVVHDDISSNPLSFWESTSALQPFTREPDTPLIKEVKPCLAVQVIDHVHRANYIWSIAKLKHRLRRMRRLYDYTDRPLFTGQHFNREDPFYETPCPRFSLIGLARVPLRNLTLQLHADNYVDVYCRNTGKVMGQIRVLVTPIARSVSRKHQKQQQQQRPTLNTTTRQKSSSFLMVEEQGEKYLLHIGQQQVFEIRIQELKGVSETNFTQVHAQFRLSSFGNVERYSTADKIYQTDPISNFDDDKILFDQCQTLSIHITENMMDVILNQGLTIEVYGQAQEDYLYGLVEHVSTTKAIITPPPTSSSCCTTTSNHDEPTTSFFVKKAMKDGKTTTALLPASTRFSMDRRFTVEKATYDGILMEERHDVLAWIQICELNANGEYVPVQVMSSTAADNKQQQQQQQQQHVFCLRQGLQRRIAFTLSHDSGKQFEWLELKHAKIGNVRLVDNKGKITDSPAHDLVDIQVFTSQQHIVFERNGISKLTAQGSWDSSLHDSLFLNRVTSSGQRIRLTLSWQISCDKCIAPLCFDMDIYVQIGAMTSSSSASTMFRSLLGGAQAHGEMGNKCSGMFMVNLKPPMTRQVRELWRLNTANKYVRGEEFIGSWKPRGVSLISDYRTARQRMIQRESVAAFRHSLVLAGHPQTRMIQRSQSGHIMDGIGQLDVEAKEEEELEEEEKVVVVKKNKEKNDPDALTKRVIDLWKSQFGTREEIVFNQDPPSITSLTPTTSTTSISSLNSSNKKYSKIKLTADIQQLHPSDTITKRGYLLHPENVDETWLKHWFVLRRPFIIIYEDQHEIEEIGVFNLTSARVDYKTDLEEMLQRKNTFAIYTHNNAYLLQAADFEEMKDWISKVDQFYPVDKLLVVSSSPPPPPPPPPSSSSSSSSSLAEKN